MSGLAALRLGDPAPAIAGFGLAVVMGPRRLSAPGERFVAPSGVAAIAFSWSVLLSIASPKPQERARAPGRRCG